MDHSEGKQDDDSKGKEKGRPQARTTKRADEEGDASDQGDCDHPATLASSLLEGAARGPDAERPRVAAEEQALTAALGSLKGNGVPTLAPTRDSKPHKRAPRKANGRTAQGRRTANKSTAERLEELRALLGDGPKSRAELAAELKVSPARVQQLPGALGGGVSSQPAQDGRGKLWSVKVAANGAGRSRPKRRQPQSKGSAARGRGARKRAATK